MHIQDRINVKLPFITGSAGLLEATLAKTII